MTDLEVNNLKFLAPEPNPASVAVDAVVAALRPFRPGVVTLYYQQSFTNLDVVFSVEVENLPDDRFKHSFTIYDLTRDRHELMTIISEEVYEHFSNLPHIPPPDDFGLGEN